MVSTNESVWMIHRQTPVFYVQEYSKDIGWPNVLSFFDSLLCMIFNWYINEDLFDQKYFTGEICILYPQPWFLDIWWSRGFHLHHNLYSLPPTIVFGHMVVPRILLPPQFVFFTPNHGFWTYGGPEDFTSTIICILYPQPLFLDIWWSRGFHLHHNLYSLPPTIVFGHMVVPRILPPPQFVFFTPTIVFWTYGGPEEFTSTTICILYPQPWFLDIWWS